jgi:TRAP transporter TAXI family solute receptor
MRVILVAALALSSVLFTGSGSAQTARKGDGKVPFSREAERAKANENLLVIMGGGLGGPYLQLAHDIAVAVNDGNNLRVLPVASDGAFTNVRDIVLVKGVDLAITTVQVLNALKASGEYGNIQNQIAYIAPLAVDTFHVLARPEINSIQDLEGKKASFNTKGSGTARFGPQVLKALGVSIIETAMPQGDALQAMRDGTLAATLCSCPLPVPPFPGLQASSGFKFIDVPYVPALEQDYVPANLTDAHYPNLIPKGSKVQTIATSTILITYNWPQGTERYRKVEKFVNAFFANIDKLKGPARHPTWRSVNLSASIRGWQRFSASKQWLDRQALEASAKSSGIDVRKLRAQAVKAAPYSAEEQDRLFKEFLEWSRQRPKK